MSDVMIDIETLGNGKNACVIQIGACYFDRVSGDIGNTFKKNIDWESVVNSGGEMDVSTVQWWMNRDKAAIESIMKGPFESIHLVMSDLNEFLSNAKCIWSHATFDFVIITETLKRLKIKPKFRYQAARDIRTLVDIAKVSTKSHVREGVHHDGLDDAIFQVKYCVEALRKVRQTVQ